jgi:hypothetical protein
MSDMLFYYAGMIVSAGLITTVAAFIINRFLKNIYLSVIAGYGCLLLLRVILSGFAIHGVDLVVVAIAFLVLKLVEKKGTK